MSAALANLDPEVRALIEPHMDDEPPGLDAIGIEIAGKRDESKQARSASGIEAVWMEAEEAYVGIDDANRHEYGEARWSKPMSSDGPLTTGPAPRNQGHRSTVYLRLTSRYVDAGSAKLGEILLPADDKAFTFKEMPVPDLIDAQDDDSQVVHAEMGVPLTRPANDTGAPGAQQQRVPLTVKDLAVESIEMARKKAKAAETRIYDWMVETGYRGELRKVIFDAARIGVGVVKAPTPKAKRVQALERNGDDYKLIIKDKVVPAMVWIDPWNAFPDPACGENINDGDYFFERDHMSARQVRGLKKLPGYIAAQIDRVLKEGPDKANVDNDQNERARAVKTKGRFEVWYFYGMLTREEMASINAAAGRPTQSPDDVEEIHAIVTLINDSVVKAVLNPLDSGSFPYHSVPWQRRAQHWAGVGVAEQMKTPQRVANAALRALLNNAGKAAGSQFILDQAGIRPADGEWTITPDKVWLKTNDGPADVRQAFMAVVIPDVTQSLERIIELGERFAEETTSIPLITQGQSGATTPDTLGATQIQNNNANQLLRSIGYSFDDYITEPVVRQYYEWLLLDPDVPNEEKGEYQIDAHGSIALVERAIQDQSIAQMGAMAANPAYGIDPKKWATEFIRTKRLDPATMQYTKEEQEKMAAIPPPDPPVVAAAKVAADTQLKLGVMKQQTDQQTAQAEQQVEQAAQVLEGHKTAVGATIQLHDIQQQHERALMEIAAKANMSLAQVKSELARTAMQLQTETQLNATNNALDLHKHRNPQPPRGPRGPRPAVQAPGRAADGQAGSQVVQ